MSYFILSLHDPVNSKGALGVFCSKNGLRYLQIEEMSPLVVTAQIRGIAIAANVLYALTPSSIRMYSLDINAIDKPVFQLDKEIVLPEWLRTKDGQGNLLAINICNNKIYVGCNALASIDEFDLDLNFIQRRYLWDISPKLFIPPKKLIKNFKFGHIRNITQTSDESIYLTIASCNNTDNGVVINYETGEIILDQLVKPHGGIFDYNNFFVQEVQKGLVHKFSVDKSGLALKLSQSWSRSVTITDKKNYNSERNLRGMSYDDGEIYCGVCSFNKSDDNFISRVVSFDIKTGEQKKDICLPDLEVFRKPRIFFMEKLELANELSDSVLLVYQNSKKIPVKAYFEPKVEINLEQMQPKGIQNLSGQVISDISKNIQVKKKLIIKKTVDEKVENKVGNSKPSIIIPSTKEKDQSKKNKTLSNAILSVRGDKPLKVASRKITFKDKLLADGKSMSVSLEQVSLCYQRNAIFAFGKKKHLRSNREFCALKEISFELYEGETVGLIGRNGSGKSTMGMLIAGTLEPDKGVFVTKGRVQLLSLGVGFRKDLTGRDNVFISATLLGMSRKMVAEKMSDIEAFAELGDFIDEPVRTYSAGMRSRLAFAVATAVEPDILILDEVMSTGDMSFRKKAQIRMKQMQGKVKTVVMVSHNSNQIKRLCNRVIWLEKGYLLMDGKPDEIVPEYEEFCQNTDKWLDQHPKYSQLIKF